MRITRTIDGKNIEIELLPVELSIAYEEQEHIYDMKDVQNVLDEAGTDDDIREKYGFAREEINKHLDDMAYEKRRNINKYDMDWRDATEEAIYSVLDEYQDSDEDECPLGGDIADDCADCAYACDYHYDPASGECVRRED